jgi:hypothetical protein
MAASRSLFSTSGALFAATANFPAAINPPTLAYGDDALKKRGDRDEG